MKRILSISIYIFSAVVAIAQVDIVRTDYGMKTLIAPLYFGPNAFPVPEMLDGSVSSKLSIELAADGYFGYEKDRTADLFARLRIPLFTDRVNLSLWMPIVEFYQSNTERLNTCRVQPENQQRAMKGHTAGDVYVSTDIMFLKETAKCPAMAVRAAVKTASGGDFELARTYDNPGYFFDLSIGKSFFINKCTEEWNSSDIELRIAASGGFLCWQTDNGRQNDAFMYGTLVRLKTKYVSIEETFAGYVGWEKAGDQPMTIKTQVSGHIKGFEPFVLYQYGIKDYPFHQIRVGLKYYLDILHLRQP